MYNEQQVRPTEAWNVTSLIPKPAALYMHSFAMFVSFSFLLTHPAGQQYDTQQLGGGGLI